MKLHSINKNNLIILKYIEKNIKSSNNPIYSLKLSFCSNSCDKFEYKNPKNKKLRSIQTLAIQAGIEDLDLENLKSFTQENIKQITELLKRKDIQELIKNDYIDGLSLYNFARLDKEEFKQLLELLTNPIIKRLLLDEKIDT